MKQEKRPLTAHGCASFSSQYLYTQDGALAYRPGYFAPWILLGQVERLHDILADGDERVPEVVEVCELYRAQGVSTNFKLGQI